MSDPVEGLELLTAGIIIPKEEWVQTPFLIRLYGFAPLHPLLLWTFINPHDGIFDGSPSFNWSASVQPLGCWASALRVL